MKEQTSVDIAAIDAEHDFFVKFEKPPKEKWEEEAIAALKGAPFDKLMYTRTYEGLTIESIYCAEDIEGLPHLGSKPGFAPFVHSTRPNGFIRAPWKICQELTQAFPREFNEEAHYDLSRGQTTLNIIIDRPSAMGLNPDQAPEKEVGMGGVSLSTPLDLSILLNDIDLNRVPIQCYTGVTALPFIAMLATALQKGNTPLAALEGCIGSDPLGFLVAEGELPCSLKTAYTGMYQSLVWSLKMRRSYRLSLFRGITITMQEAVRPKRLPLRWQLVPNTCAR